MIKHYKRDLNLDDILKKYEQNLTHRILCRKLKEIKKKKYTRYIIVR